LPTATQQGARHQNEAQPLRPHVTGEANGRRWRPFASSRTLAPVCLPPQRAGNASKADGLPLLPWILCKQPPRKHACAALPALCADMKCEQGAWEGWEGWEGT
jgi:hypothetical protein